jgi:hypothetical protein
MNKVIVPKLLPIIFYQQLCFQAPTNHCQHAATTQKKLHTNTHNNRTKKKQSPLYIKSNRPLSLEHSTKYLLGIASLLPTKIEKV